MINLECKIRVKCDDCNFACDIDNYSEAEKVAEDHITESNSDNGLPNMSHKVCATNVMIFSITYCMENVDYKASIV